MVLWVVGGSERQIIMVHCIGSWLAVCQHELFKNFIWQHRQISANGGCGGSRGHLVCIGNVSVEEVAAGMVHIDAGFVVIFL